MLNLIYGLLALAVLIALIGIANTLALSIHERVREIGLLRAVGMTRRQVRTAVRWESVLIALLGTALGMSLAVLGSWGIVHALRDQSVTTFRLPFGAADRHRGHGRCRRSGGRHGAGPPGFAAQHPDGDQHGLVPVRSLSGRTDEPSVRPLASRPEGLPGPPGSGRGKVR